MRYISGELVNTAKFHHPASIIVSGSSGVGKTTFCLQLVKNQHFTKKIKHVYYFGCIGGKIEEMDFLAIYNGSLMVGGMTIAS